MTLKLNGSTGGSVSIDAPAATTGNADITFSLPVADGSNGQVLQTNGSGQLSFGSGSQWTTSGSNIYYTTGSVGIGTTSPPALLSVHGTGPQLNLYGSSTGSLGANFHYNGTTGNLGIATNGVNASSNPQLVLDLNGRLLVGTSTSASAGDSQYSKLQVRGNTNSPNYGGILNLGAGATTPVSGSGLGVIVFTDGTGSEYGRIDCFVDATPGTNDYPGRLVFSTTKDGTSSPTGRMKIDHRGYTSVYADQEQPMRWSTSLSSGLLSYMLDARYGATGLESGTQCFRMWTNGNIENTNNSYGGISDIKFKENIVDANSQWDDLKAIQVRNYNFKEETGHQTHTQIGLIAQEVELISPGLVITTPDKEPVKIPVLDGNGDAVLDKNGDPTFTTQERETGEFTKSINYSVLYMKAVKALQEAMERIETLEAKVTALEGGTN